MALARLVGRLSRHASARPRLRFVTRLGALKARRWIGHEMECVAQGGRAAPVGGEARRLQAGLTRTTVERTGADRCRRPARS